MNVTREEKMAEAIERMKALRVFKPTIKQFKDDGYISISEPPFGAFYWAEGDDLKRIHEFEEQNNALVYLVVRSYMRSGWKRTSVGSRKCSLSTAMKCWPLPARRVLRRCVRYDERIS